MKPPLVIISKGKNPYSTTAAALQSLELPNLKGKKILIKPNAARLASPGEGITTHPQVVAATIDLLRERGAKEVVIGEGCIFGVDAQEAFEKTGLKEISQNKGVKLIDLDRFEPEERIIPDGKLLKKIKVSSAMSEFDWLISIPVMKTHMHTWVSLSIKNMKGLLWRKEKARFHQLRPDQEIDQGYKTLDVAISEMATILMPDLAIIDGTVGMEGMGPAYGRPKEMGVVLVSHHPLSADAMAARLMGFNPENIPHLKLCSKRGMGEIRPQKILVKPKNYFKWGTNFEPSPSTLSISFPDVVLYDEGSCSGCLSTLLVFLREYHSQLNGYHLKDKNIHIGIGKHLKTCPAGTILVGNCTVKMRRRGIFVHGCPPVSSQIMKILSQKRRALSSNPSWAI